MSNSAQRDARNSRDESARASDTDRIQIAQLLAYAAEQGRLQLTDYEDRLARAYAATTYQELDRLRADLPGAAIARAGVANAIRRRPRCCWRYWRIRTTRPLERAEEADHVHLVGQRGAGSALRRLHLDRGGHPCVLDHGAQTILLPPEVNVEIHGHRVMGGFDRKVVGEGTRGAPTVRIRGFSLWGDVGIKRKPRKPRK